MTQPVNSPPPQEESPRWGRNTKLIVAVVALLLTALLARRFTSLIAQLVIAAIIAYILNPVIIFVDKQTTLKRGVVLLIIYLLLAVAVVWAMVALGVAAFQQVSSLINLVPELIEDGTRLIEQMTGRTEPIGIGPLQIAPNNLPWNEITQQMLNLVEPVVGQGGQFVRRVATSTVRWLGNMLFIFVISIYIALEIPRVRDHIGNLAQPPGYRKDAERLMREFGRIWSAYLRGQVILGVVIFFVVWIGLSILGVQNALALGILSGLLEFIPLVGPLIGAGAAIVVAFFQPANYLGLPGWQYALLVVALMILIQQLENNILVPRIVGEALDIHPLLVIIAVFMGGSLAGILGAILAAPVAATLKLIGTYAWRKMFDLPPFPKPEPQDSPPSTSLLERGRHLLARIGNRGTAKG